MKDRDRILAYLRRRISDPSDFYQTHYHLVRDACDKFGADPAEVLQLYEQLQEDAELHAAMGRHHSSRSTRTKRGAVSQPVSTETDLAAFGWDRCPESTRCQVEGLVRELQGLLTGNLIGIYLHGSLAAGCFNPRLSDIDLLAVTRRHLASETQRSLIEVLLRTSRAPHPLEISFLCQADMVPWQYPTPFDLHYSEDWRDKYTQELATGAWRQWAEEQHTDEDLAVHITVTRAWGICLWGEPIVRVFPEVPARDFAASITADLQWALERLETSPVYGVLNACRIYAYFKEGHIYSKAEGAAWALLAMPAEFQPVIEAALATYRSPVPDAVLPDVAQARRLLHYVADAIGVR